MTNQPMRSAGELAQEEAKAMTDAKPLTEGEWDGLQRLTEIRPKGILEVDAEVLVAVVATIRARDAEIAKLHEDCYAWARDYEESNCRVIAALAAQRKAEERVRELEGLMREASPLVPGGPTAQWATNNLATRIDAALAAGKENSDG